MTWFKEKRFGMFIHWGLYAILGEHEQYWQRWNVPGGEYVKLADKFNPVDFDPAVWLDLAQEAGMEYLVFTAKHHDGFCMWNSRQTDFNIMNTPYGRDVFGMLAEECHKRDFPLVVYYSVVDWHHPAYPNIGRHHEILTDPAGHDMAKYVDYVKRQIQELCTNYGIIHGIWWDMNVPEYKDPSIHELIRELQPLAVINNRGFGDGDFSTPERDFDPENANPHGANLRLVEACQSVGVNSWGYRKNEDYFSSNYLMQCIDKWLADGANYLLNIGPDSNGIIPRLAENILENIGTWLQAVRPSFNGTPVPRLLDDNTLKAVQDGKTLYVHRSDISSSTLKLKPLQGEPLNVSLMNTGQKLDWTFEPIIYERGSGERYLRIRNIPVDKLNGPAVIKLEFDALLST
jgi:alpha-L-fucosidase